MICVKFFFKNVQKIKKLLKYLFTYKNIYINFLDKLKN